MSAGAAIGPLLTEGGVCRRYSLRMRHLSLLSSFVKVSGRDDTGEPYIKGSSHARNISKSNSPFQTDAQHMTEEQ